MTETVSSHELGVDANATRSTGDPFVDPIESPGEEAFAVDATLSVGRNASLTLGTDSLIVLGRGALRAAVFGRS